MRENDKLYPCIICGAMVKIRCKGKCPHCRKIEVGNTTSINTKVYKRQTPYKVNSIRLKQPKEVVDFFKEMISIGVGKSIESGEIIYNLTSSNICHILPKRDYKSVATNKLNIIILTADEHSRFDKLLDRRDMETLRKEFPNTINEIKKRLSLLLPEVDEAGGMLEFLKTI